MGFDKLLIVRLDWDIDKILRFDCNLYNLFWLIILENIVVVKVFVLVLF